MTLTGLEPAHIATDFEPAIPTFELWTALPVPQNWINFRRLILRLPRTTKCLQFDLLLNY